MGGLTAAIDLRGLGVPTQAALDLGRQEFFRGTPEAASVSGCSIAAWRWADEERPLASAAGVLVGVHGYFFGSSPKASAERLLTAYLEAGKAGFLEIDGEFAFILWDSRSKSAFLGRDPFSTRPLFYASSGRRLAVATEIRQVLRAGVVQDRQLNFDQLWPFLKDGEPGTNPSETMFRGVRRALPGVVESFALDARAAKQELWKPPTTTDRRITPKAVATLLPEALSRSVRRRRLSKPAFLLSGGLDSPFVAAVALRDPDLRLQFGHAPTAFTEVAGGHAVDESERASRVAAHLGLKHVILDIRGLDAAAELQKLLSVSDQPLQMPGLGFYALTELAAAQGFRSLVGGLGGDTFWHFIPREVSPWDLPPAVALLHFARRLTAAGKTMGTGSFRKFARETRQILRERKTRTFHSTATWSRRYERMGAFVFGPYEGREQVGARMGVSFSEPFFDREVAEIAFAVEPRHLLGLPNAKRLLAMAARDYLPAAFINDWEPLHYSGFLAELLASSSQGLPVFSEELSRSTRQLAGDAVARDSRDPAWPQLSLFYRFAALVEYFSCNRVPNAGGVS